MSDNRAAATISWPRLRARLDALAEIGDTADGGCARLALTDADKDGRDLVVTWMRDLACATSRCAWRSTRSGTSSARGRRTPTRRR
jgi:N-carbamoyl-L-amino-acid hydrolase